MLPYERRWAAPVVAGSQLALLGREPELTGASFSPTLGSGAGTWLALVALEVDVWMRTESSGWIAALLIADLLPTFVDRPPRRAARSTGSRGAGLMIGADLVRFGVFAVLPFTTSATPDRRAGGGRRRRDGLLPSGRSTPGCRTSSRTRTCTSANSLLQTVDNLTWALGSLAGGVLVAASGVDAAYWINACTFLISARLPVRDPAAAAAGALRQRAAATGPTSKDGFALTVRSRRS